jgi:predicted CDP-diglyceride synthetase/phosphatidate cytidylyltransferase
MSDAVKHFMQKTDWMKTVVGVTVLFVFTFQCIFLAKWEIPERNENAFHILFGIVDFSMSNLLQYYFGSSKGSQDKQEIIKAQNEKINS